MESLNSYLTILIQHKARELRLEPNQPLQMYGYGGKQELTTFPLTGAQISTTIFPLIPANERQKLPSHSEIQFNFDYPGVGQFNVLVRKSPSGFIVSIKPEGEIDGTPQQTLQQPEVAAQTTSKVLSGGPAASESLSSQQPVNFAPAPSPSTAQPQQAFSSPGLPLENNQQPASTPQQPPQRKPPVRMPPPAAAPTVEPTFSNIQENAFSQASQTNEVHQPVPAPAASLSNKQETFARDTGNAPHKINAPLPTEPKIQTPQESAHSLQVDQASIRAMEELFRMMAQAGASDLHLSVGMPPLVRKDGRIIVLDESRQPLSSDDAHAILTAIMPSKNREEFARRRDTDFAYELPGIARYRCNVFMDRKGPGGVFRLIPHKILTAEELGLSQAILNLCRLSKGLVVVTGPTGSGKSTTLCAMIDFINRNREDHIITIEDPIEFVHENKRCLINQREVFTHTEGFKDALRAALREDPDIVLVGEMRDLETISIAIETAETGHLVFGTLHTTTAASTVDRIIDQFPADRQAQIRVMLSESLRGVIAQTLLKKKTGGRIAALEVLVVTPAVSNLIREGKTFQITSSMQTGKAIGMVCLNDALIDLAVRGTVEPEEAYLKAVDKTGLEALLKRNNIPLNLKSQ